MITINNFKNYGKKTLIIFALLSIILKQIIESFSVFKKKYSQSLIIIVTTLSFFLVIKPVIHLISKKSVFL